MGAQEQVVAAAPPRPADEWFEVAEADYQRFLRGVPGVRFDDRGRNFAHRTHRPLLAERRATPETSTRAIPPAPAVDSTRAAMLTTPDRRARADAPAPSVSTRAGVAATPEAHTRILRPYQIVGRDFLLDRRSALLADMMRLGKTPTSLATHDPNLGKLVVVAPLQTRDVWMSWMERMWPNLSKGYLTGRTLDLDKLGAECIFIHYDIARYWQTVGVLKIGTLILDECHLLQNESSFRWQACTLLSTHAQRVIGLTGTPVWNKPESVYSILSLLTPGAFGSYRKFTMRYCSGRPGAYGWVTGQPSNELEFQARMSEVMLRRTWDDVAPDLPPITRTVELAPLSANDVIALDKAAAAESKGQRHTTVGDWARYRRLLGQWKAGPTVQLALQQPDEPLVVWCWHKDVAQSILDGLATMNHGRRAYVVTGDQGVTQRDGALNAWRKDPNGVLIISIAVGQVGIDLSHARHAILCEQSWTPAEVAQAEMRTFSPMRPMSVTYVVADHWLDRRIVKALIKKCRDATKLGLPAADSAVEMIEESLGLEDDGEGLVDFFNLFDGDDL